MTRPQPRSYLRTFVALATSVALMLVTVPDVAAGPPGKGSVKHSSKGRSNKSSSRGRATTSSRRGGAGTSNRRPATRPSNRASARGGYRAGYRRGSYNSRHNAWTSWRRWRAVTGLIVLGVYSASKPKQATTVVVTPTTYYYAGGVYYVQSGSGYVVVAAPPGAVVHAVPTYTTVVYVGTTPYYYSGGAYYVATDQPAPQPPPEETTGVEQAMADDDPSQIPMIEDDHNYEVVAPPVGATVAYLPDEADEETVGGKKYFVYADTYYRPYASDGETIYMVVEDPTKA